MDLIICILLLLFCCTFLQALCSLHGGRSKVNLKLPPGPSPFPLIGNLLELGNKPHKSLAKLAEKYGPMMSLQLGQVTTIVVSSADMAKGVLQTHDQFLSNRTIPNAMEALNHHDYSLAFLNVSPPWRFLRKICVNQLFGIKVLDASQDLRRQKLRHLLSDVLQSSETGEPVDIGRVAIKTTINLMSNTLFSEDLIHSVGKAGEFKETVSNIMKEIGRPNLSDFFPVLKRLDLLGVRKRIALHFGKLLDIFHHLVTKRLKLRESLSTSSLPNNDILDALLHISQQNPQDLDTQKIERLSLDLFVAGTDTVATTVEWGMAELLRDPKVMSKAKAEMEQVLGKGTPVEESDIERLPYLQAILKETFRLHPAAPFLVARKAERDVELGGYVIPKGAQVLVNVWTIARDPGIWENPEAFSPERFLGSEIDVKGRNFQLTPFGGGRRICPGYPLALRMLFLMLGSLINCFDWKLEGEMKPQDIDMDDKFGLALAKACPVRAVPFRASN